MEINDQMRLLLTEILDDDSDEVLLSTMVSTLQHQVKVNSMLLSELLIPGGGYITTGRTQLQERGLALALEEMSDEDFFYNLRVTKKTATYLVDLCKPLFNPETNEVEDCLKITLWFLGHQDNCAEIADLFGLSDVAVYGYIEEGVTILCSLSSRFIKWPLKEATSDMEARFRKMSGFPGILGVIDGCHININPPSDSQDEFLDRSSNHSVHLIAVCDDKKRFTFVDAGSPGAMHINNVFKQTQLYKRLQRKPLSVLPSTYYHLIGSTAFELSSSLLVPYRNSGPSDEAKRKYNTQLMKARYVSNQAFGLLRSRFRILSYINTEIILIPNIILACCTLHNITMNRPGEEAALNASFEKYSSEPVDFPPDDTDSTAKIDGIEKRDFITTVL